MLSKEELKEARKDYYETVVKTLMDKNELTRREAVKLTKVIRLKKCLRKFPMEVLHDNIDSTIDEIFDMKARKAI